MNKYWSSEATHCELCQGPLEEFLTDGRTVMGPWAVMCDECLTHKGVGLGTGRGQRYQQQKDGRWLKVEG